MANKRKMIIIGGGFAGLNLAKKINKEAWDITIIDSNNYHSFPPLFYQIASSGLDPGSISFPFRREMRKGSVRGCRFHMGEVKAINVDEKWVETQFERLEYDSLVIASGTTNNFFGNAELYKRVFTLKSVAESIRIRNEVLDRLERASVCSDEAERKRLLSFVVIGGGPSGVEVAGALGEMKRYILRREYPDIKLEDVRIILLEGTDRLLRTMSETSSKHALEYLGHLMVEVRLNTLMKSYEDCVVTLDNGDKIYSETVVWTAGVTGVPLTFIGTQVERGPGNRFMVDEFNRVKGLKDVYAIGDISLMMTPDTPKGHPQLAQVAIQQAHTLARNLNAGEWRHQFRYNDKGSMATVGRNRAVADLGRLHLYGRPAWFTWMFIHLISILGMRNKITVLINWIWAYCTYTTSLRLLMHPNRYPLRRRWGE